MIYLITIPIDSGFFSTMTPKYPENILQETTPSLKPIPYPPSQKYG